jgi:excinuclease UvrABC ATPase subunit
MPPNVRAMLSARRRCLRCNGQGWYRTFTAREGWTVVAPCPVCFGTKVDPGNRRP